MDEHSPACVDCLVYEAAGQREMDEQVGIIDVLDADAEVTYSRCRVVGWDRLGANGDNVRDTSICERPWRNGSVDPARKNVDVPLETNCQREAVHGPLTCPNRACRL